MEEAKIQINLHLLLFHLDSSILDIKIEELPPIILKSNTNLILITVLFFPY